MAKFNLNLNKKTKMVENVEWGKHRLKIKINFSLVVKLLDLKDDLHLSGEKMVLDVFQILCPIFDSIFA